MIGLPLSCILQLLESSEVPQLMVTVGVTCALSGAECSDHTISQVLQRVLQRTRMQTQTHLATES